MRNLFKMHFLSAFITLAAALVFLGSCQTDMFTAGVFERHPRVKWIYKSPREFYPLPPPLTGRWAQQEFTDAGLFGDRLVLCCRNRGGTVQPKRQHIYIVDANNGKELRDIALPRIVMFYSYVKSGRLVVVSGRPREYTTKSTYDLKTGVSTKQDDETSSPEHSDLNELTNTLEYIAFERITEPPGPDRPYESTKHVWVGQAEPDLTLVQEVHPGSKRYNLYLETVSDNGQTNRIKLIRLRRFYPSFHCWVGYNSSGDYLIVLKHVVLAVRKSYDSAKD